jgi:toluene monooxygenase system ferredoxin subunit
MCASRIEAAMTGQRSEGDVGDFENVMTYHDVCDAEDLWIDEMEAFVVAGRRILVIRTEDGFKAFSNICPHQDVPLVEGQLDGCILTCRAHHWSFDITTGLSVNPANQRLVEFPVRVEAGMVQIGETPLGDK